jgi:hypothetical protein
MNVYIRVDARRCPRRPVEHASEAARHARLDRWRGDVGCPKRRREARKRRRQRRRTGRQGLWQARRRRFSAAAPNQ